MDAADLIPGDEVRPVFVYALNIKDAFFLQLVTGIEQALFPFRMRRGDGPVKGREKDHAKGVSGLRGKLRAHRPAVSHRILHLPHFHRCLRRSGHWIPCWRSGQRQP